MRQFLLYFFVALLLQIMNSCNSSTEPKSDESCLIKVEEVDNSTTGFLIFEADSMVNGLASGTKINIPFGGSSILLKSSDAIPLYTIDIFTRWETGELAERLLLNEISLDEANTCFDLTNNEMSKDSVYTNYIVRHEDIVILPYVLNNRETNKLEIISFDETANSFEARFNASFEADTALLPEFPKRVDFIDVHVQINN